MTNGPIQSFDFHRLQNLVTLVNGSPFRSEASAVDPSVTDALSDQKDVIVMRPGGDLFKSSADLTADVARDLKSKGVSVGDNLDLVGGVTAKIDPQQLQSLEKQGYTVFDNSPRTLVPPIPNTHYTVASGATAPGDDTAMPKVDPVALMHADQVQQQGYTGKGQVVAVIDSGFSHPSTPLVAWKDFVDNSATPLDPVGHGTHVAGDVLHTAPDARILSVRVMNAQGQGRPSDIIKGIQWTIDNQKKYGITAINMSLGGPPEGIPSSQNPLDQAVEAAVKKGIVVLSAAGNSGPNPHSVGSPADDPLGIAVGSALDRTHVSTFSSRGPTDDGRTSPDVAAPGEFIVSWAVKGSQMEQMGEVVEKLRHMNDQQVVALLTAKPQLIDALGLPKNILTMPSNDRMHAFHQHLPPIYMPDPNHIAAPGTSFASPLTTGVAVDLMQANPNLGPQGVKDALVRGADPMQAGLTKNDDGAGFVDAENSLQIALGQTNNVAGQKPPTAS